jgi:hypothetical protein
MHRFPAAVMAVVIPALLTTSAAAGQNPCDPVHTAYNKSFQMGAHMAIKNSGAVNVTEAQGVITGDAYTESCQLLRDETLHGEAASVYTDVMKAPSGTADGKVWISKASGLILQQQVDVDMAAKGKGQQTIVFDYKK